MLRRWHLLTVVFSFIFLFLSAIFHWIATAKEARFLQSREHQRELVRWEASYALVMVVSFGLASYGLAKLLNKPIVRLRLDIESIDPHNPWQRIKPEGYPEEYLSLIHEINQLLSKIQKVVEESDKEAAQLAHELKVPLTLAKIRLEKSLEKMDPEIAEEIDSELERLKQHMERAILLNKAEKGNLTISWGKMELGKTAEIIIEGFRLLCETEQRHIHVEREEGIFIEADSSYLKQILYNLMANAMKHGTGDITVRMKKKGSLAAQLLVFNKIKPIRVKTGSLGLGKRIIQALVSAHGNMTIRYKQMGSLYCARLSIYPRTSKA
ncbi:sensor histidine kinase [Methylacidiphilum caldifontis]|uniref:histidine kinase n=1 Tax=Methylacidiphilum caldifontis TaxID=2795386 RepID=A0A4Y8PCX1_9BACT|nr:HAMP domain-containing sensor histidine kinase [Methylacidiphilum caldifontis]QSR87863.1 HAMP domain-containing histidine kinase [Methylacidiphilum caldifontis]TFE68949.1 histidine kinase [Methylacidiphilum caldifontis]